MGIFMGELLVSGRVLVIWLVVSTHLKNMLVKLEIFPNFRGENGENMWNHHPEFDMTMSEIKVVCQVPNLRQKRRLGGAEKNNGKGGYGANLPFWNMWNHHLV